MKTYDAESFFGMQETEASIIFNLSLKNGDEWKNILLSKFVSFESILNEVYQESNIVKIESFREKISKNIWNEKTLLRFMCGNNSIENGTERFLNYFKYNIRCVKDRNLTESCVKFQKHLCYIYRKYAKEWNQRELDVDS